VRSRGHNKTGILAPLAHTRFRRLWLGQLLSAIGDGIFPVALVGMLLTRDQNHQIGLVLGAEATGSLVAFLAGGILADRTAKTRVMISADLLRLTAITTIALFSTTLPLPLLAGLAACMGAGTGLFRPAYGAAVPEMLPNTLIQSGNALRSASGRLAAVLGPALGGAILTLTNAQTAFTLDALTFLAGITALVSLRGHARPTGLPRPHENMLTSAREGLHAVLARPWVTAIILQGTLQVAFVIGPTTVLLALRFDQPDQAHAYGLLLSAQGLGMLTGTLLAARLTPKNPGTTALLALLPTAGELTALATNAPYPLLLTAVFTAGTGSSIFGVLWITALQHHIPTNTLGRVLALDALGNSALQPLGMAITSPLVTTLGLTTTATLAAFILILTTLAVLPIPGIRTFAPPRPKTHPNTPTQKTLTPTTQHHPHP